MNFCNFVDAFVDDEDEFESDPDGSGKKRKRLLILESDGSEDEYKPGTISVQYTVFVVFCF